MTKKNEASYKRIEPKTSDMDIDNGPMSKKPIMESLQGSDIAIHDEVEEVEG